MRYLITLTFYFLIQSISFAEPLKDFTATYELYHNEFYVGKATRKLTTKDNIATFTSVAETAGVAAWFFNITITETSELSFKNNRLNFLSYHYNEKNKDKEKDYKLSLVNSNKFYNSHTKKHYPAAKNLHDTLGFTVAIMHELQAGKRKITYTIAEKDKIKTYTLKFITQENLETNNGTISTLKMEHYNPETQRRFTFWCAENMDFLPVRIRNINKKGDENLLNLTHLNQKQVHLKLPNENID